MGVVVPSHLEELFPRSTIQHRVKELAQIVDGWAAKSVETGGPPLLALCVLRGGVFFFSDLLQQMVEPLEPSFCRAWSYVKGINGATEPEVRIDWITTNAFGRDVVLVDNICDSGRTLAVLAQESLKHGARSVRTVTLVHRLRSDAVHAPDLAGFTYSGKEWLVGYGLRDGELRSNWPNVYRVVKTAR